MKTLLSLIVGLAVGLLFPLSGKKEVPTTTETPTKSSNLQRETARSPLGLAERAATLSAQEWPAFFEAHLAFASDAELLAQLWAEADPAGFWQWLREGKDRHALRRFGPALLTQWAASDAGSAMDATLAITSKDLGDYLRRHLGLALFALDVRLGASFAARCPDFNRFGWGAIYPWMTRDPGAAVRALGRLPNHQSDFRKYLDYTLPIWAKEAPTACLSWLSDNPPPRDKPFFLEWVQEGFRAVALLEPEEALATALQLENRYHRELALQGVLASGEIAPEDQLRVLKTLPITIKAKIGQDLLKARRSHHKSLADLQLTDTLLRQVPANENTLHSVGSLADSWAEHSPETAWEWARSLPDAPMRRAALESIVSDVPNAKVGELPENELSDALFQSVVSRLHGEKRDQWIQSLPPHHAAWARDVAEQSR